MKITDVQIETPTAPQLMLAPFPDGACLKYLPRPSESSTTQQILVDSSGRHLAITVNVAVANLLCDAVNLLAKAHFECERQQSDEAELQHTVNNIIQIPK